MYLGAVTSPYLTLLLIADYCFGVLFCFCSSLVCSGVLRWEPLIAKAGIPQLPSQFITLTSCHSSALTHSLFPSLSLKFHRGILQSAPQPFPVKFPSMSVHSKPDPDHIGQISTSVVKTCNADQKKAFHY